MMYEQRNYVIFEIAELDKIDFTQVLETSADTVRKSLDGTITFVKWDGDIVPDCILSLTTNTAYLTYEEMSETLLYDDWTSPTALMP